MGKVIFGIIFLCSLAGNIYILYSVFTSDKDPTLRQLGYFGFAVANLVMLIFGLTYYILYKIKKANKTKAAEKV
jgi:hypothetical protein